MKGGMEGEGRREGERASYRKMDEYKDRWTVAM